MYVPAWLMSEPTRNSCSEQLVRKHLDVTLLVRSPDKHRSQAEEEGCPERLLSLHP